MAKRYAGHAVGELPIKDRIHRESDDANEHYVGDLHAVPLGAVREDNSSKSPPPRSSACPRIAS